MDPRARAAFAATSLVRLAVPGPMVLMAVAAVLGRGPRAARSLACGTVSGDATKMALTLVGMGTHVAASDAPLAGLRWAGSGWRCVAGGPARAL